MKVLIVCQYYWPEPFRVHEVALALRSAGCDVSVLTGQPNYPDGDTFPGYRALASSTTVHEGIVVHRVPLLPRGRHSATRLVLNYLSFVLFGALVGLWKLRNQRFDVVFVYGLSPILMALPAIAVRRRTGGVLLTWVQDLWPESLAVTGYVRNKRVLAAVGKLVGWIYRHNDLVLAQSEALVSHIRPMADPTPVEYHPNPGELSFGASSNEPPALTLRSGFNVVFAGNLGTVQALDTVIEAATLLRDDSDIRFVLIGSGSKSAWLQAEIQRRTLTNVDLPGRFPPNAMPALLTQASALLVSLINDPVLSQTVPSKVQAYMAAGRPLLASLDGEGARVVLEAGAGLVSPANDAPALAASIRKLALMHPDEREQMGQSGRAHYLENFEPNALAEKLKHKFAALIEQRAAARHHER